MSGFEASAAAIEILGLFVGVVPLLSSAYSCLTDDVKDFGIVPALALRFCLFEAKDVVDQVREHFIRNDGWLDQAMTFKDSYTPTFNMVGVAGATIAQIALTALSLPNLDDTHWTARAAFTIGLVAGSLAVFCSCVLQSKMSGLHSPYAVRRWLTRPQETFEQIWEFDTKEKEERKERKARKNKASKSGTSDLENPVPPIATPDNPEDLSDMQKELSVFRKKLNEQHSRPSLSAALIITAPSQLLNVALGSLLTGFGICFGIVYTARLPAIEDHHSALAVLIVYIVSVASGLVLFYLPMLFKLVATMRDGKGVLEASATNLERLIDAAQRKAVYSKTDDTLSTLKELVCIQGAQLRLQEDLMTVLEFRFGVAAGPAPT